MKYFFPQEQLSDFAILRVSGIRPDEWICVPLATQNLCSQLPVFITTFFRENFRLVQEKIKTFFHVQFFFNISIESNRKEKINKFKIMENNTEIRKTETLHIRLTPDDKQLIEQYAKMMNFSISAFIKRKDMMNYTTS